MSTPIGSLWKRGELTNALEVRKVENDNKQKHRNRGSSGEAAEASSSDSLFEGEEEWEEG